MSPSIGRIVHYIGWAQCGDDSHFAAVITHVWSVNCVNLYVFPKGSPADVDHSGVKTSVMFDPSACNAYSWHWPEQVPA